MAIELSLRSLYGYNKLDRDGVEQLQLAQPVNLRPDCFQLYESSAVLTTYTRGNTFSHRIFTYMQPLS